MAMGLARHAEHAKRYLEARSAGPGISRASLIAPPGGTRGQAFPDKYIALHLAAWIEEHEGRLVDRIALTRRQELIDLGCTSRNRRAAIAAGDHPAGSRLEGTAGPSLP
jgi:hypothetical protein